MCRFGSQDAGYVWQARGSLIRAINCWKIHPCNITQHQHQQHQQAASNLDGCNAANDAIAWFKHEAAGEMLPQLQPCTNTSIRRGHPSDEAGQLTQPVMLTQSRPSGQEVGPGRWLPVKYDLHRTTASIIWIKYASWSQTIDYTSIRLWISGNGYEWVLP